MAAYPFRTHPEFARYATWAASQDGVKVTTGISNMPDGEVLTFTQITSPRGHILIDGTDQDERLLPSTIAYYDRRLGLESPWQTGEPVCLPENPNA